MTSPQISECAKKCEGWPHVRLDPRSPKLWFAPSPLREALEELVHAVVAEVEKGGVGIQIVSIDDTQGVERA